jgi:hypothetical protein
MLYDRDTCYMTEAHVIWQRHMLYDRDTCYMTETHVIWQRHMLHDRDTCYIEHKPYSEDKTNNEKIQHRKIWLILFPQDTCMIELLHGRNAPYMTH